MLPERIRITWMVQVGAGVAQGAYSWLPIKAYLFPSLICACILVRFLGTQRNSMLPGTLIDYVLTSCAVRDRLVRCRVAATGRLLKRMYLFAICQIWDAC